MAITDALQGGNFGSLLGLGGFSLTSLFSSAKNIASVVIVLIVCAGIAYYYMNKSKKIKNKVIKKIGWWEEINGRLVTLSMDEAEEIIIPGTNLRAFYIKKRDMWLPRFTRAINQDLFYLAITKNREIVNFTLKSLEESMKEAGLDYDHTDMRWANENTREFIKRNYRDKSIPWWKEYKDVIATVVILAVMVFGFVIIIYFLGGLVEKIGLIADKVNNILDTANKVGSSGIINGEIRT